MAEIMKRLRRLSLTIPGQMAAAVVYLAMLCAVAVFFTGHGEFIYEGF